MGFWSHLQRNKISGLEIMPNKTAKLKKQKRLRKNKELKTKGRTKKQYQRWLKKQGDSNVVTSRFR